MKQIWSKTKLYAFFPKQHNRLHESIIYQTFPFWVLFVNQFCCLHKMLSRLWKTTTTLRSRHSFMPFWHNTFSDYIASWKSILVASLPPANEVCEGYDFTGVCLSTGRGRAWQGACMVGGYVAGGCAWQGGMHGRGVHVVGGHAWQAGGHACHARPPPQILWLRHTVNERAVHILLECILILEMAIVYMS